MDEGTLWLIVLLVILFGKNLLTTVSGVFTNGQAIPGSPDGLPFAPVAGAATTQNQAVANPVATPSPWSNTCLATIQPPPTSPVAGGQVVAFPATGTPAQPIVTFQQ